MVVPQRPAMAANSSKIRLISVNYSYRKKQACCAEIINPGVIFDFFTSVGTMRGQK